MKVIKPRTLGLLTRTFERDKVQHFVVTILAMTPLRSPSRMFPESELWKFAQKALGENVALDDALPKVRGEVLVTGSAHNVGGPRPSCVARVRVGDVDKSLQVIGDRVWPYDAKTGKPAGAPTPPKPFDEMPLDWRRAYGGPAFARNPLGRGHWTSKTLMNQAVPLPNVEDPKHLVTHPDDQREPAGFGGYDIMWPQRFSKVGTHDARWLAEQFPGFALDMDLGIFNTAPADQQLPGFFRGDEDVEAFQMHPVHAHVVGKLPRLVGRAFITQRTPSGEELREIPMRLDTVHLFPNHERSLVVFRGVAVVADDDADDVVNLMIAADRMGQPPRDLEHYRAVLANRLDRRKGAMYALRDRDLAPDPDPDAPAVDDTFEDELDAVYKTELLQVKALERRGQKELAAARDRIAAAGLDPVLWTPPQPAPPPPVPDDPVERAEMVDEAIETSQRVAKEAQEEAEKRAREACADAGLDYDAAIAKARAEAGGPPKFSAREEIARLHTIADLLRIAGEGTTEADARANDAALHAKLFAMEQQLFTIYRGYAHHYPPAPAADDERSRELREEVASVRADPAGRSLRGRDLTGANLAGLDFSELDLGEALLEGANLEGCSFERANLEHAVLTRASMPSVKLDGASMAHCNLGGADLRGASLRGAKMKRAVLAKALLDETAFDGATLDDADLSETSFRGTSFAGVKGARLTFMGATLEDVSFAGAEIPKGRFVDCKLTRVTFAGAKLEALTLMNVAGEGLVFDDALLDNLRCVQGCHLGAASLLRVSLQRANLRGASLEGANLEGAKLSCSDFSKANLTRANLRRAVARETRFDRTDLTHADLGSIDVLHGSLRAAIARGTDLRGASLFGADMLHMVVDRGTKLDGANLDRVRFVAKGAARGS